MNNIPNKSSRAKFDPRVLAKIGFFSALIFYYTPANSSTFTFSGSSSTLAPTVTFSPTVVFEYDYSDPNGDAIFDNPEKNNYLFQSADSVPASYPGNPNEFFFNSFTVGDMIEVDFSKLPFDRINIEVAEDFVLEGGSINAGGKYLSIVAQSLKLSEGASILGGKIFANLDGFEEITNIPNIGESSITINGLGETPILAEPPITTVHGPAGGILIDTSDAGNILLEPGSISVVTPIPAPMFLFLTGSALLAPFMKRTKKQN